VKGYPEAARCGLSALAVRIPQQYGKLALVSILCSVCSIAL